MEDVLYQMKPGTAIATFDQNGNYQNVSGQSHAAIFLRVADDGKGVWVMDQWHGQTVSARELRFDGKDVVKNASKFCVIHSR